jgi:prepilin-type N-terminal cleavage/methylation domain-containing protein
VRIKQGFTLIEAVMVMALLAVLSFGIGNFIVSTMNLWVYVAGRQDTVKAAQNAMNRMVAEIKDIKTLSTKASAEINFTDIDSNQIDFKQTGTTLYRVSGSNNDILATGLGSPEGLRFTYLDTNEAVTAVAANVRSVRITLTMTAGSQRATLESGARIRAYDLL